MSKSWSCNGRHVPTLTSPRVALAGGPSSHTQAHTPMALLRTLVALLLQLTAAQRARQPIDYEAMMEEGEKQGQSLDMLNKPGLMDAFPKKPKPAPLEADIPYLKYPVCEDLAKKMYFDAEEFAANRGPKPQKKSRLESSSNLGKLEEDVETMLVHVCDPEHPAGRWIRERDVVKSGSALKLNRMPLGKCRRECRTIEKICMGHLDKLNDEDLGEVLLDGVREKIGAQAFAQRMCVKMSKVCKKGKVPPFPEGAVRQNEEFWALDADDIELERQKEQASMMKDKKGNVLKSYDLQDLDIEELEQAETDSRDILKDEV